MYPSGSCQMRPVCSDSGLQFFCIHRTSAFLDFPVDKRRAEPLSGLAVQIPTHEFERPVKLFRKWRNDLDLRTDPQIDEFRNWTSSEATAVLVRSLSDLYCLPALGKDLTLPL